MCYTSWLPHYLSPTTLHSTKPYFVWVAMCPLRVYFPASFGHMTKFWQMRCWAEACMELLGRLIKAWLSWSNSYFVLPSSFALASSCFLWKEAQGGDSRKTLMEANDNTEKLPTTSALLSSGRLLGEKQTSILFKLLFLFLLYKVTIITNRQ